jgi:RNA-directed DNA polymerase
VQTAARMVLEPIFEREFAPHSYGFRPGRSCHHALARVDELLLAGHVHVVDIDIKGYFDSIPQEKLLDRVGEQIADGRVMDLLRRFLKAGVLEEERGEPEETEEGTPQGGVISPLLANIYLNPLDWLMAKAGYEMVRYADDMVVLCRDEQSARLALETVAGWMRENGLVLHPEKTRIVDMAPAKAHFDFLGYRFFRAAKGQTKWLIRPKSEQKFKMRLKPLTRRSSGKSLPELVSILNPLLRGFYGYFKKASKYTLEEVDGWVRERLRGILRKRRGCSQGRPGWRDRKLYPNSYFHKLGLFCLEQSQAAEMTNLQQEAC